MLSLRGIKLVLFIAESNVLNYWGTDVDNACLEAELKEKVYIIADPEFGELEGHVTLIQKLLYGLRTSDLKWYDSLADYLRHSGFFTCKMVSMLQDKHEFKLKGTGTIEYYLGCDFYRNDFCLLFFAPLQYVEKMADACLAYFWTKPKTLCYSTLKPNRHPELYGSPILD